ncbi:MAG: diketogulonate related aldo/keto reductase [Haloquadratum sp. J07HQX50]|nr:MAG: diketogulonate related aldo/keto reductase [Haloquadratum sp. J07HQX50]
MSHLTLPPIGLGTWENDDPDQCRESVKNAIEMGYRHIDTARFYQNESAVGAGIAAADVGRDDIFLASKVHPFAEGLSYTDVIEGFEKSLSLLEVSYLDLLYIHWPVGDYNPTETLAAFDDLVQDGRLGHVGVSNFDIQLVEEAMEVLDAPLFANQVERHPLLPREDLLEHAQMNEYTLVSYSPLARGNALSASPIQAIARERDVSPASVTLAWVTDPEAVVAIPKATGADHLIDNLHAGELRLTAGEIERINDTRGRERFVDRDGAPWH